MTKVVFTDWRPGFQKVKFTQLLRDRCGLGLAAANSVTGTLLRRQPVEVEVADTIRATELVRQAADLGAIGLIASASSESCSALTV